MVKPKWIRAGKTLKANARTGMIYKKVSGKWYITHKKI